MSLSTYKYICENGHAFEAAGASNAYGVFIARGSLSSLPGVLVALGNSVYSEVNNLLEEGDFYQGLDDRARAQLLRGAFSAACDPAPDGTLVQISRLPSCPRCSTRVMASWEPLASYDGPVFEVTHQRWKQLSTPEKLNALSKAVQRL